MKTTLVQSHKPIERLSKKWDSLPKFKSEKQGYQQPQPTPVAKPNQNSWDLLMNQSVSYQILENVGLLLGLLLDVKHPFFYLY